MSTHQVSASSLISWRKVTTYPVGLSIQDWEDARSTRNMLFTQAKTSSLIGGRSRGLQLHASNEGLLRPRVARRARNRWSAYSASSSRHPDAGLSPHPR